MVTVGEVANRLSGAKSFTSLDACSGYWQLPVNDETSKLLPFNTRWGRYRFTRHPFGISPAAEIYQREMDKLFEGVPVEIIVDDFLIHGKYQLEVDDKLRRVLDNSREIGLKFNPKKVKLRVPEVSYVGHFFSSEGLHPDPKKIRAINDMPPPEDKGGVLRIEHKADIQEPISQLNQKDAAFVWDQPALPEIMSSGQCLQ